MKTINGIKFVTSASRMLALGCTALLVIACEQTQLPIGAQLSISPDARTLNIPDRRDADGNCFVDPGSYVDQAIVLAMVDGSGSPLGDVEIRVYVDFSGNTFPGPGVMALYDDRTGNNNGIIDDFELVSGEGEDIVTVKTDYYGGDRPLLLRINTSCPFKGDVFAYSDGVTATSAIELVTAEDSGGGS